MTQRGGSDEFTLFEKERLLKYSCPRQASAKATACLCSGMKPISSNGVARTNAAEGGGVRRGATARPPSPADDFPHQRHLLIRVAKAAMLGHLAGSHRGSIIQSLVVAPGFTSQSGRAPPTRAKGEKAAKTTNKSQRPRRPSTTFVGAGFVAPK